MIKEILKQATNSQVLLSLAAHGLTTIRSASNKKSVYFKLFPMFEVETKTIHTMIMELYVKISNLSILFFLSHSYLRWFKKSVPNKFWQASCVQRQSLNVRFLVWNSNVLFISSQRSCRHITDLFRSVKTGTTVPASYTFCKRQVVYYLGLTYGCMLGDYF